MLPARAIPEQSPRKREGFAMKRALFVVGFWLGAGLDGGPALAQEKSLYERLGGEPAITAVVDDLTSRAAANPRVNFLRGTRYATMDIPRFKKHLVNLI